MKFIKIAQTGKNNYLVLSKKGDMLLGCIEYFDQWHKFVFVPEYESFFDVLCMIEIGEYIGLLKKVV